MTPVLQRLPALHQDIPPSEEGNLIDRLLAEQKNLQTPVARFSENHDRAPDLAAHYRSLIPLSAPATGEQYAFEVALDRCTGCKACVSACHSLNGLDEDETWRDTGNMLGGGTSPGLQQTITTACHHCEDPACMDGCPVGAYEKDAETGIVRHLDDQCIGCSYCILKCPYDVPKYSRKRGIVRKCDMCHQRLAVGEAPACVQACPTEAIRIVKIARNRPPEHPGELVSSPRNGGCVPDFSITRPTTRYTGRVIPDTAHAADRDQLIPQHAHWPLILMLVLTQSGWGMLTAATGITYLITGACMFMAGMAASIFHLGQPMKAWRFFLGLRTSWLSREILAFSLLAPLPILLAAFPLLPVFPHAGDARKLVWLSLVGWGIVAIFTSVMIYHDTRRQLWKLPRSAVRFFGTAAAFATATLVLEKASAEASLAFAMVVILKLIPEARLLGVQQADSPWSPDGQSARLQRGPLRRQLNARIILALLAALLGFTHTAWILPVLLAAEILERQLFFQSVHAPKMPGNAG